MVSDESMSYNCVLARDFVRKGNFELVVKESNREEFDDFVHRYSRGI